jgi:hypothetical protein
LLYKRKFTAHFLKATSNSSLDTAARRPEVVVVVEKLTGCGPAYELSRPGFENLDMAMLPVHVED